MKRGHFYFAENRTFLFGIDSIIRFWTCFVVIFLILFWLPTDIHAITYVCPLNREHITGVMQWQDGFPFNAYGRATHGQGGDPDWHAVDINGFFGSSVLAMVDGTVVSIEGGDTYVRGGHSITIRGQDGLYYQTAHVTHPQVYEEQRVIAGQKIGQLLTRVDATVCDIRQEFTTSSCSKIHTHVTIYRGELENPSAAHTLEFLSRWCELDRPSGVAAEFPRLPTINCAKITGNRHISRCFATRYADINGDGKVTLVDIRLLIKNYLALVGLADTNSDGRVNAIDFGTVLVNLGH